LGKELQTPNINGKNKTYYSHKLVSTSSRIIHELAYKQLRKMHDLLYNYG